MQLKKLTLKLISILLYFLVVSGLAGFDFSILLHGPGILLVLAGTVVLSLPVLLHNQESSIKKIP